MGVCGNYAKHYWTHPLRPRDRVCVRCGLPCWDRRKTFFQIAATAVHSQFVECKDAENGISPLKQVGVKGVSPCRAGAGEVAQGSPPQLG
jgi:hypothetical protein